MRKDYQNQEIDTSQPAVPDTVSVALAELAGEMREGLLALAVGTGLQVMAAIMEADVTAACGPKGRHDPERTATRHGHGAGSVSLGGRRVPVERPRMRAVDGSGELPVAAYELFSDTEVLGRMALDRMLAGLSTRHYRVGLEPVGARTEQAATATSQLGRVAPVRRPDPDRPGRAARRGPVRLDLVAFMVDGVHFGEHTCVVALGIDIDGAKHPLSLVEGSTENATLVTELIVGLRERGLDVTRPILAVLDGSKALRRAVLDVFDRPVIGRCQLHKIRNVQDHLPEKLRTTVASRMRRAYHADSALAAEAELCALAAELDRTHPGAAASLREGMAETLTVLRLGIPPTLARTFRSTNAVESMISICRTHASNVKNWRDGTMALRWCAAGWSRPASSSVASTGTCTCGHCATRSNASPNLSVPPVILTPSQPPDDHRAATEIPRNSGHPPHIDEGLDFLGWHIQRRRKRGTNRRYVYTYPRGQGRQGRDRHGEDAVPTEHQPAARSPAAPAQPGAAGLDRPLPTRGVRPSPSATCAPSPGARSSVATPQTPRDHLEGTPAPFLRRRMVARRRRGDLVQPRRGADNPLPLPGHEDPHAMAEHRMSTQREPQRDLWRAGCVDEAHVRFGGRPGETGRWRHRHRAPGRPLPRQHPPRGAQAVPAGHDRCAR